MNILLLVVLLAAGLAIWMALAWAIIMRTGNSGWADAMWSLGIGIAGIAAALVPLEGNGGPGPRSWLVAILVAVWSVRLAGYIMVRTLGGAEDPRYAQLRRDWGTRFPLRLLGFLEIQAVAALVLAVVLLAASRNPAEPGWGDALGLLIAIVAVAGEGLSDMQLRRFRADPDNRGRVCDRGLWGLTRHPNYFFEWLAWVAYLPIGFAVGYAWGGVTLLAPLMMYWLLVHVSGIPPLEAHMVRSRGDAFRDYQARVRAFWPLPKRRGSAT